MGGQVGGVVAHKQTVRTAERFLVRVRSHVPVKIRLGPKSFRALVTLETLLTVDVLNVKVESADVNKLFSAVLTFKVSVDLVELKMLFEGFWTT